MRALVISHLVDGFAGAALQYVPAPERKPGEVLVRIKASSLNFPDVLMTQGKYQFKPDLPFIGGLEFAGEVVEADLDSMFSVGDRVIGGNKTGAFAEMACVPETALHHLPSGLSFAEGAAMGAAYTTAYTGLVELCSLKAGQWVLVHGASGGVGLAAVDLAKSLGARVIAASGVKSKLANIDALYRPDATILAQGRFRDRVREITAGHLCDVVFDPVGGDIFDESTRCTVFGGRLVVVGFTSGRIAEVATNIPLIKGFSIVGLRAGEYARHFPERGRAIRQEVSKLAEAGRIKPAIDRILPLSKWREGFGAMANRELVGKVIFEPEK